MYGRMYLRRTYLPCYVRRSYLHNHVRTQMRARLCLRLARLQCIRQQHDCSADVSCPEPERVLGTTSIGFQYNYSTSKKEYCDVRTLGSSTGVLSPTDVRVKKKDAVLSLQHRDIGNQPIRTREKKTQQTRSPRTLLPCLVCFLPPHHEGFTGKQHLNNLLLS